MTTNIKLKLIGLFTTLALFALPVADTFANRSWSSHRCLKAGFPFN